MTEARHDRRIDRQRERRSLRRATRQGDCILRAAILAAGGDPDDFMTDDSAERATSRRGPENEGWDE